MCALFLHLNVLDMIHWLFNQVIMFWQLHRFNGRCALGRGFMSGCTTVHIIRMRAKTRFLVLCFTSFLPI